jgi:hypothetical protein
MSSCTYQHVDPDTVLRVDTQLSRIGWRHGLTVVDHAATLGWLIINWGQPSSPLCNLRQRARPTNQQSAAPAAR